MGFHHNCCLEGPYQRSPSPHNSGKREKVGVARGGWGGLGWRQQLLVGPGNLGRGIYLFLERWEMIGRSEGAKRG